MSHGQSSLSGEYSGCIGSLVTGHYAVQKEFDYVFDILSVKLVMTWLASLNMVNIINIVLILVAMTVITIIIIIIIIIIMILTIPGSPIPLN